MTTRALLSAAFALMSLACSVSAAEPVNEFTSTAEKKSKLLEEGDDSFKYRCKGIAGYEVIYEGSHGRSWINLVYDSEQTDLSDEILEACPGTWPVKANDVVQWRGVKQDRQFVPYAVIFRMASVLDEASGKKTETLVIIKLAGAGSQVVGKVPSNKGGNAAAEALADKLCRLE
jgi:hypothetical protein